MVAVMFSIVPGLGHIYKGHILARPSLDDWRNPRWDFCFPPCCRLPLPGWGLGLFFFYLAAVMLHAYGIHDRVVPPPKEDEGEEY